MLSVKMSVCGCFVAVAVVFLHLMIVYCQKNAKAAQDSTCSKPPCSCCVDTTKCGPAGVCGGQCREGYFGGRCLNKCPVNCPRCQGPYNPNGKHSLFGVANCTECKDGYYSTTDLFQCQLACSPGCVACTSGADCFGCKMGYFREGDNCTLCSTGCASCVSYDNCTRCQGEYFMDDAMCSPCQKGCDVCTAVDNCTQCLNGYFLEDASCTQCKTGCAFCTGVDACARCVNKFYDLGNDLNSLNCASCSQGCRNMCDKSSGTCTCKPDYTGKKCDRCVDGRHGHKCSISCQPTCATCITWSHCTSCVDGYYLLDHSCQRCSNKCVQCLTSRNCTECIDKYYGETCNMGCSKQCLHGTCDRVTGACLDGCLHGYSGDKCCLNGSDCKSCSSALHCSECMPGIFGDTCTLDCPEKCAGNICHKDNGTCDECIDGFLGDNCTFSLTATDSKKDDTDVAIGIGVAGAVVGIGIVLIAIVFYKRRACLCCKHCGSGEQEYRNEEAIRKLKKNQEMEAKHTQKVAHTQLELKDTAAQSNDGGMAEETTSTNMSQSYVSLHRKQTREHPYSELRSDCKTH